MPWIQPGKENARLKRILTDTEAESRLKAMFKDRADGNFYTRNASEKPMWALRSVTGPLSAWDAGW